MFVVRRSKHNPLISPDSAHPWEASGAFNCSAIKVGEKTLAVYRALSANHQIPNFPEKLSVIGVAESADGFHFENHRPLITPEAPWERFGCEDPRLTKLGDNYYIFYTALSEFPFRSEGIKTAVVKTKDFKTLERHLVTPFNAKGMALFPEKIDGKLAVVFSINTDRPPAKIAFAFFDKETDIWSTEFWNDWVKNLDHHTIDPRRSPADHIEVGAPPIKTKDGWLLIYAHIQNYFGGEAQFGVEALLLDLENPLRIIGRTKGPFLVSQEKYETDGYVKNIVFPSGAILDDKTLKIFYGAADTVSAMAEVKLENLLAALKPDNNIISRVGGAPILEPRKNIAWEAKAVFNPSAIELENKIHLLYRAQSEDNTSTLGYASSKDGVKFNERLSEPVYTPREPFEMKKQSGNSGCEDPRLTLIDNIIYMLYTAFDGVNLPRIAATSISVKNFLAKNWLWKKPVLISPFGVDDKDAFLFPKKIGKNYLIFHRVGLDICVDPIPSLDFTTECVKTVTPIVSPRKFMWDSERIGINTPPIESKNGWIVLYHGISKNHHTYRVGAILLDKKDPAKVLARTTAPIFEPEMPYEKEGQVPNVVFPCGTVVRDGVVFIYYGAADKVIGLAKIKLTDLEKVFE